MNRSIYYDYIDEKLHTLASRIDTGGKLNVLSLHNHSENFYLYFFNLLYGWELLNLNKERQNVEGIDLIDKTNKIIIQVSATCTKQKVNTALEKNILRDYPKYSFKFISIAKDASGLRKATFKNPHGVLFNPEDDIYDITSILQDIFPLEVNKMSSVYQFIKDELGNEIDIVRLDSNLATIINILAKENWNQTDNTFTINSFEIERKISVNNLKSAKFIIDDYKIHQPRLDKKYTEFDTLGTNKSISVLGIIRNEYVQNSGNIQNDELFFLVIENIQSIITQSPNFVQIPAEELILCIHILIVDSFIRCKIFENPQNYSYATT